MTVSPTPRTRDAAPLPHWERRPADLPAAIRRDQGRAAGPDRGLRPDGRGGLRRRRGSGSGREVDEIAAARDRGETIWPVIDYADIAAGTVVRRARSTLLRRRGCLVVRGHFDREQASAWDRDIVDYVEGNEFFENYRGPGDDFFGSVGSKPEIYPIYWSPAQMQARQSDRMATVQAFLNAPVEARVRRACSGSTRTATRSTPTASAAARRAPTPAGLGTHLDPGTLDLWMTEAYQKAFRHLFDGTVEQYDPWDAAHRTAGPQYPGSTMCSAFRTFQGWTALSDMDHDQGVLHTVPIPEAMAYLMLRPLLRRRRPTTTCAASPSTRSSRRARSGTRCCCEAVAGIPDVKAGDSVWWHCDMIHSVAPVEDQKGWGNVMYIPAAPWCPRNEAYADRRARGVRAPAPARATSRRSTTSATGPTASGPSDLNDTGRRGLGLS